MYFPIFIAVSVLSGSAAQNILKCDLHEIQYYGDPPVCQVITIGKLAAQYGPVGFPQYGIPPIEPTPLNSTSSTFFDIFKLFLIDGTCFNIVNTCRITYYEMDTENFRRIMGVKCGRIVIKFNYELMTNPYFCQIFGDVNGCGNATIVLKDWIFYFNDPFKFVKRDGNIYLKINFDEGIYKTKVEKIAIFDASSIRVNDRDITNRVLRFINKYWKLVLNIFGGDLFRLAKEYYRYVYEKIYYNIPATSFYTNDLTPYLNEEDYEEDVGY